MASVYSCKECGSNLNLQTKLLYPPDFYFEAGNRGTLSFTAIHFSKFNLEKEINILPFFETVNHWGIHRNRTKINCNSCGYKVGYVYYDGPPLTKNKPGQTVMDLSQIIPRAPRFRFKIKSLIVSSEK